MSDPKSIIAGTLLLGEEAAYDLTCYTPILRSSVHLSVNMPALLCECAV